MALPGIGKMLAHGLKRQHRPSRSAGAARAARMKAASTAHGASRLWEPRWSPWLLLWFPFSLLLVCLSTRETRQRCSGSRWERGKANEQIRSARPDSCVYNVQCCKVIEGRIEGRVIMWSKGPQQASGSRRVRVASKWTSAIPGSFSGFCRVV